MVEIRQIYDLGILMKWRIEVIRNVFGEDADSNLTEENYQYYQRHISDNTHLAVVANYDGIDCGCGGVCYTEELPSPDNPSGKCAYLMNIYVREAFRNKGVAHSIISKLVEEAKKRGCAKIYLETTAVGKPVYSSLGFRDMAGMMKFYDTESKY